jgi:hypothetical protein
MLSSTSCAISSRRLPKKLSLVRRKHLRARRPASNPNLKCGPPRTRHFVPNHRGAHRHALQIPHREHRLGLDRRHRRPFSRGPQVLLRAQILRLLRLFLGRQVRRRPQFVPRPKAPHLPRASGRRQIGLRRHAQRRLRVWRRLQVCRQILRHLQIWRPRPRAGQVLQKSEHRCNRLVLHRRNDKPVPRRPRSSPPIRPHQCLFLRRRRRHPRLARERAPLPRLSQVWRRETTSPRRLPR